MNKFDLAVAQLISESVNAKFFVKALEQQTDKQYKVAKDYFDKQSDSDKKKLIKALEDEFIDSTVSKVKKMLGVVNEDTITEAYDTKKYNDGDELVFLFGDVDDPSSSMYKVDDAISTFIRNEAKGNPNMNRIFVKDMSALKGLEKEWNAILKLGNDYLKNAEMSDDEVSNLKSVMDTIKKKFLPIIGNMNSIVKNAKKDWDLDDDEWDVLENEWQTAVNYDFSSELKG